MKSYILFFSISILFFVGCNPVKHLTEDQYLIVKNKVIINGKKKISYDINELIRQKPNTRYFGFSKFPLHTYNLNPAENINILKEWEETLPKNKKKRKEFLEKNNWSKSKLAFNYWFYKIGSAPVLLDSIQTEKTLEQIKNYYQSKGFLDAKVYYKVKTKRKRAKVTYEIKTDQPYNISSYTQQIPDLEMKSLYEINKEKEKIKTGTQFKQFDFEAERNRVYELYRNKGYYDLRKSQIEFVLDSSKSKRTIETELVLDLEIPPSNKENPRVRYKIEQINIYFDSNKGDNYNYLPVNYKGYIFHEYSKLIMNPQTIIESIDFYPNDYFVESKVKSTYSHLRSLNNFRTQIKFQKDSIKKNALISDIFLLPLKKYQLFAGLESSFSNNFGFGITGRLGFLFRNIFRKGENLSLNTKASLGTVETGNPDENRLFNAREYGVEANLTFPRFLIPFIKDEKFNKEINPQTILSASFSRQNNIGLGKIRFKSGLTYNWQNKPRIRHELRIFDNQYIRNQNIDAYFTLFPDDLNIRNNLINDYVLENPELEGEQQEVILNTATADGNYVSEASNQQLVTNYLNMDIRRIRIVNNNLISASSYTFTYDERADNKTKNPFFFQGKVESSGSLLDLFSESVLSLQNTNDLGEKTILGVAYSQYLRLDLDFRKYIKLGGKKNLAIRFFGGVAHPYGNSVVLPFDKSFFAGGANDIRGWRAFDLGPADFNDLSNFSVGNIKLLSNLEYRFNYTESLQGAFFVDAGNIWTSDAESNTAFNINDFYKELGVSAGLGFRYDFGYFLLRLDGAWRMHDPEQPIDKRWVIDQWDPADMIINFGIGYPF